MAQLTPIVFLSTSLCASLNQQAAVFTFSCKILSVNGSYLCRKLFCSLDKFPLASSTVWWSNGRGERHKNARVERLELLYGDKQNAITPAKQFEISRKKRHRSRNRQESEHYRKIQGPLFIDETRSVIWKSAKGSKPSLHTVLSSKNVSVFCLVSASVMMIVLRIQCNTAISPVSEESRSFTIVGLSLYALPSCRVVMIK